MPPVKNQIKVQEQTPVKAHEDNDVKEDKKVTPRNEQDKLEIESSKRPTPRSDKMNEPVTPYTMASNKVL